MLALVAWNLAKLLQAKEARPGFDTQREVDQKSQSRDDDNEVCM